MYKKLMFASACGLAIAFALYKTKAHAMDDMSSQNEAAAMEQSAPEAAPSEESSEMKQPDSMESMPAAEEQASTEAQV